MANNGATKERRSEAGEVIVGICDFTPQWHEKSGTLLGIGQTVRYRDNQVMHVGDREMAYAVYDPSNRIWSAWETVAMKLKAMF